MALRTSTKRNTEAGPVSRPSAAQRAARIWIDPRLIVGIVLVVASVIGVVALVAAARVTTPIYAAAVPLARGDVIEEDDLQVVDVTLGAGSAEYWAATGGVRAGAVATRPIDEGELVPRSAVGGAEAATVASVVVDIAAPLATRIERGAAVEIWSAERGGDRLYGEPEILVPFAEVGRITESSGILASGSTIAVEVILPRGAISEVLRARANEASISLVALDGPLDGAPDAPLPTATVAPAPETGGETGGEPAPSTVPPAAAPAPAVAPEEVPAAVASPAASPATSEPATPEPGAPEPEVAPSETDSAPLAPGRGDR